jgi:vacuolar-type H+-ATPase subunit E/Vma4
MSPSSRELAAAIAELAESAHHALDEIHRAGAATSALVQALADLHRALTRGGRREMSDIELKTILDRLEAIRDSLDAVVQLDEDKTTCRLLGAIGKVSYDLHQAAHRLQAYATRMVW